MMRASDARFSRIQTPEASLNDLLAALPTNKTEDILSAVANNEPAQDGALARRY